MLCKQSLSVCVGGGGGGGGGGVSSKEDMYSRGGRGCAIFFFVS